MADRIPDGIAVDGQGRLAAFGFRERDRTGPIPRCRPSRCRIRRDAVVSRRASLTPASVVPVRRPLWLDRAGSAGGTGPSALCRSAPAEVPHMKRPLPLVPRRGGLRAVPAIVVLAATAVLAACNSGASILPSVSLPSVAIPSVQA